MVASSASSVLQKGLDMPFCSAGSTAWRPLTARLHAASNSFKAPKAPRELDWKHLAEEPITLIRSPLEQFPALRDRCETVVKEIRRQLDACRRQTLDFGFCHGDLHYGNARIRDGQAVFFDFDCCGMGFRAYDLATFQWAARIRGQEKTTWAHFIEGYRVVRSLTVAELSAIPTFVALRHLWIMGVNARNAAFSGSELQSEQSFEKNVSFLESLTQDVG
jgi:Ser/Thr protein kinase RdoA (MazF antagonist)